MDQRTHEGRYAWPSAGSTSSNAAAHVFAVAAANGAAAASQAALLSATQSGAFSRLSPYEALYPGLHSSPSTLTALRNFSPGE